MEKSDTDERSKVSPVISVPLPPPPPPKPPKNLILQNSPKIGKKKNGLPFPLIFPPINVVPPSCHPKLESLMKLMKFEFNNDNPKSKIHININTEKKTEIANSHSPPSTMRYTSAVDEIEQAQKKCHQFYKIMEHYIELNRKEKLEKEKANVDARQNTDIQTKPKDNKEVSSKNPKEKTISNEQLENAAKYNYQFCMGKAACPQRLNALMQCWLRTQTATEKHGGIPALLENGFFDSNTLCQKERKSVERCSGELVQRFFLNGGRGRIGKE